MLLEKAPNGATTQEEEDFWRAVAEEKEAEATHLYALFANFLEDFFKGMTEENLSSWKNAADWWKWFNA